MGACHMLCRSNNRGFQIRLCRPDRLFNPDFSLLDSGSMAFGQASATRNEETAVARPEVARGRGRPPYQEVTRSWPARPGGCPSLSSGIVARSVGCYEKGSAANLSGNQFSCPSEATLSGGAGATLATLARRKALLRSHTGPMMAPLRIEGHESCRSPDG